MNLGSEASLNGTWSSHVSENAPQNPFKINNDFSKYNFFSYFYKI